MKQTYIISVSSLVTFIFLVLNTGFAQDTIVISPHDTTALKNLPDQIQSIMEDYQKEKTQRNISLKDEGESVSLELDGLIIDETISKIGHDFYKYYNDFWNPPEGVNDYTIYISEKLMPGMGNLVIVRIDEQKVFQNRIRPRDYVIEKIAKYATNRSRKYLQQSQDIKQQLEEGDMSGTGIY